MYSSEDFIIFDKHDKVYNPGDCVSGRVFLKLHVPQRVTGILANFRGYCEIKSPGNPWWHHFYNYQNINNNNNINLDDDDLKQEYFNHSYFILGSQDGSEMYLQAGNQCFPFTFELPKELPSSFNCKDGFIQYTVTISLMRMIDFERQIKSNFKILSRLNLNDYPECRKPGRMRIEQSFYKLCIDLVPVMIDVQYNNCGYCPGDTLYYNIVCQNKSNLGISDIRISLVRIVTILYKKKPKYSSENMLIKYLGRVSKKRVKEWKDEIRIPKDLVASHLKHCKLMDLDYYLRVTCFSKLLKTKLIVEKPIVIGTIPYGHVLESFDLDF